LRKTGKTQEGRADFTYVRTSLVHGLHLPNGEEWRGGEPTILVLLKLSRSGLETLSQHAKDERTDFDWFDAELLRLKVIEIQEQPRPEPIEPSPVRARHRRSVHFDRSM